jgi:hypothetical protein
MGFKPLMKFRGTTFFKAFILNAFFVGFISALSIEFRRMVDKHQFTEELPDVPHKIAATLVLSTLSGIVVYFFMRFITGTGEGMLDSKIMRPHLF